MLTLAHLIDALTGYTLAGGMQVITDAVIDSRLAAPGALFVALPGEHIDGHLFLDKAFERGAAVALVQEDVSGEYDVLDLRQPLTFERAAGLQAPICLRVDDSLIALQTVARYWRAHLDVRVVAITGSVGKTTTKEIIAAVLGRRYRTLKSIGNLNNEIGLPISLLRLSEAHERAVLEMGFYTEGEIAFLCDLAQPQIGVITNVYPVHVERAGSLENIIRGKGELVAALPEAPEGIAILNADEPDVLGMASRTHARVVTYGLTSKAMVWASDVVGLGLNGIRFQLHYRNETLHLTVPMLGRHSVHTALRAATVGLVEGLAWQEIVEGLQSPEVQSQLRLYAVSGPNESLILDDSYNASPESTVAALNLLADMDAQRRIAVLGDMLELGIYTAEGHRVVGVRAADVADVLVTVGELALMIAAEARKRGMPEENILECADRAAAEKAMRKMIRKGDVVLVKGSRDLRLDYLVQALEDHE